MMRGEVAMRALVPFLCVAACAEGPGFGERIDDPTDGDAVLEVQPRVAAFGELARGDEASATFTVSNIGQGILDLEDITLSGGDGFTLESVSLPVELGVDDALVLTVHFSPTAPGLSEAELVVTPIELDGAPMTIPLNGVGAVPDLEVTPASLDWGTRQEGCPQAQRIDVKNVGKEPAVVDAIDVDGDGAFSLVSVPQLPLTLAWGDSFYFTALFSPEGEATHAADVLVQSNDPDGDATVALSAGSTPNPWLEETFTSVAVRGLDLMFLVDLSGSMGDQAATLGTEFGTFADNLALRDVSWSAGIHTGDPDGCFERGILRDTDVDWQSDFAAATTEYQGPTQGSGGPEFTEKLLRASRNAVQADVPMGCNEGFRTEGRPLHVFYLSDERDQSGGFATSPTIYWQAYQADLQAYAGALDPLYMHAIVDVTETCGGEPWGPGGYEDAALATGGEVLDICTSWASAFSDLADTLDAGPALFELEGDPIDDATLEVHVAGAPLSSGWTWDPASRLIRVDPAPEEGSEVVVRYQLLADCSN